MEENTNKAIAVNTVILYTQLAVTILAGLFSTRYALNALGVDDFGLFSVVGSIISFISIINTIMLSTSNRFIAVAIGQGDGKKVNEQFNVNLIIHIILGFIILVSSIPLGHWYIYNYVSYIGDINNVIGLYDITIIGTIISILGVPYTGVMIAKERFFLFSMVGIVKNLLKIPLAYYVQFWMGSKLFLYGTGVTVLEAIPSIIYYLYCHFFFANIIRFNLVKDLERYKQMLFFSVWVGLGAITYIAKNSGSALIVNIFFTSAMNAALGVANVVNTTLSNFAVNATKSIAPQITKSYASGNQERSEKLVCMASKVSFMITLLVSSPFLIAPYYLFDLWLDEIPSYAIVFTILIIIDTMIGVLNAGAPDIILASGNIKWFQIIDNSIRLLSVIVGYFVLKVGAPVYYLFIVYILYTLISVFVRQFLLNKLINFNTRRFVRESLLPSFLVSISFLPILLIKMTSLHPLIMITIGVFYVLLLIYIVGLNKNERGYIANAIYKIVSLHI